MAPRLASPRHSQRPEIARQPTNTSRSTMNVDNPAQMPSRPQPYPNDSQINGRNPTSALINVALRMNLASPAPRSTPSSAKTIPATGN